MEGDTGLDSSRVGDLAHMNSSSDAIADGTTVRPLRSTTLTYLAALLVIATISATSHLLTNRITARQGATLKLINLAGRQRMLSQRIAGIAEGMADGMTQQADGAAQLRLLAAQMETAQQQLLYGDPSKDIPLVTNSALQLVYFGPSIRLEQQVADFLRHTRAFANEPSPALTDPDLRALASEAHEPLLNGLDAAVSAYQSISEHDVRRLRHLSNALTALMLVVLVMEALLVYRPLFKRLTGAIAVLMKASTTDFLTEVMNRRAFLSACDRELARASRSHQAVCIMMLDIDLFKMVNDRYGHAVGDVVLQHFSAVALQNLRAGDLLGRLGGEEFAILLPGTDIAGGTLVAERIRSRFASTTAAVSSKAERIHSTVSIGVVCGSSGIISELLAEADKLLSLAKQNGRNRVESAHHGAVNAPVEAQTARHPA
jgi:diguanylate cyclase (GGDEF)-like protein